MFTRRSMITPLTGETMCSSRNSSLGTLLGRLGLLQGGLRTLLGRLGPHDSLLGLLQGGLTGGDAGLGRLERLLLLIDLRRRHPVPNFAIEARS